jgi:flagellar hook-associated protein 2
MAMSVDGLITGMSTTETINQLMQVEALPQTALKTKVGVANKVVAAYQSVNTRLSSIVSAAKALGDPNTWTSMKATSNSDAAIVTTQPGAAAGSFSFRVEKLAATHVVTYTAGSVASTTDATTSPVTGNQPIKMKLADGSTATLAPKDKSLQSLVDAINTTAGSVYTASAVQIGAGQYTLQLTAKDSGTAGATAVSQAGYPTGLNLLGTPKETVTGTDAAIKVGSTANAYTITSSTNTFADVMPGVTVTAAKVQAVGDAPVTVGLTSDIDGIAAKVQALVDNANVALSEIASQSKIKGENVGAGPLVGDTTMRKLTQDILGAVSGGADGVGSLSAVGVALDRSGKLTFDKQKFVDAYKADPAQTRAYFDSYTEVPHAKANAGKFDPGWDTARGLARKLETIGLLASEGVILPTDPADKAKQGLLQSLIQRRTDTISDLNKQVSAWDVRLESRKTALQRQFSSLEVALGKMQQQSSWLAGQLAGLA